MIKRYSASYTLSGGMTEDVNGGYVKLRGETFIGLTEKGARYAF